MSRSALFLLQRGSAALLAPLMVAHLLIILHASRGGLTAAEILERTRGSIALGLLYGLLVVAAAIHAPIGLRNVIEEWTPWHGRSLDFAMLALAGLLLAMGLRAVAAVVL